MKRFIKGPWLWIVLAVVGVLLALQYLAPNGGYDEVTTSQMSQYIEKGQVDEIIDTGLTLSWLTSNLGSRDPASVEICTLLRKPEALTMPVDVKYVGWDIPNEFVVGYGLDYRERYRNLRDIGTLAPHVYS